MFRKISFGAGTVSSVRACCPSQEGPLAEEDVQNPLEKAMGPPRKRLRGKQPLVPLQAGSRKGKQPL